MKPERILLAAAVLLLLAGFVAWAAGGAASLLKVGVWCWVGAAAVLSLPLVLSVLERIVTFFRR